MEVDPDSVTPLTRHFPLVCYSFRERGGSHSAPAASRFLSAASTKHRRWAWRRCRKTGRCRGCWSWVVLPESSGCPAGVPAACETPPAPLRAARQPGFAPVCFPTASWLPTAPPERCSGPGPAGPSEAGGTGGETGSVCRWGGGPSGLSRALRPPLKLPSAGPWGRCCHSKWAWGSQWWFGAPPAGSDGVQPELWGLPAGSLGLSGLPAANSSAPENRRNTAR